MAGLSSSEVEYYGMGAVATEVVAHNNILNELAPIKWNANSEVSTSAAVPPTTIHTDNQSAMQVAENPVLHKRMKHTHIRHHVIRRFITEHLIRYQHIYSASNCSDMMVKALPKIKLREHRRTVFGPTAPPELKYNVGETHHNLFPYANASKTAAEMSKQDSS